MNEEDGLICPACQGRGLLKTDAEIGAELRGIREWWKVDQRTVAEAMGASPAYLSDLERGRRNWSTELIQRYRRALDTLVGEVQQANGQPRQSPTAVARYAESLGQQEAERSGTDG